MVESNNGENPLMPSEAEMVELPAIDMQDSEESIVQQVYQMMTTTGFLHLKNIDGFDEDSLLADVKRFHDMPDTEKRKLYTRKFNAENANTYRGFCPFIANDASHKEFFDMGSPYEEADEEERKKVL